MLELLPVLVAAWATILLLLACILLGPSAPHADWLLYSSAGVLFVGWVVNVWWLKHTAASEGSSE